MTTEIEHVTNVTGEAEEHVFRSTGERDAWLDATYPKRKAYMRGSVPGVTVAPDGSLISVFCETVRIHRK